MAELEIKVGADVSNAIGGLDRLQSELNQTGKAAAIFGAEAEKAGAKILKLPSTVNQATFTLNNFTRVVQDAPYGIRGVANNIDPLVESFVRLRSQTTSTSLALKAMVGALTGPAGILLAVSTVSSLLVQFGDSIFDSGNKLSKAEADNYRYASSIEKINQSLDKLKSNLDFEADLNKLQNALKGLSGPSLDIANSQVEIGKNNKLIDAYGNEIDKLSPSYNKATNEATSFIKETER